MLLTGRTEKQSESQKFFTWEEIKETAGVYAAVGTFLPESEFFISSGEGQVPVLYMNINGSTELAVAHSWVWKNTEFTLTTKKLILEFSNDPS